MAKKTNKNTNKSTKTRPKILGGYNTANAMVNYYLVLMFTVFPLYFSYKYSNIRHDKLNVFLLVSSIFALIEFVAAIALFIEKKHSGTLPDKRWYQNLSLSDYTFAAMVFLFTLSTIFSQYPGDSFTGNQGRNNGLMLYILYFAVYIGCSRFFEFKDYVFVIFGAVCLIMYILCVLNYFYIDPLGMLEGYDSKTAEDFTSTIGNKNIMSAFCCITVPLFTVFWLNHKNTILRYFYLVTAGVGFASLISSDSEGGFLGIIPLMLVLLLYYSRNVRKLGMFFVSAAVMMFFGKVLRLFSYLMGDKEKGFGALQKFFIYSDKSYILIGVCAVLAVAFIILSKKKETFPRAVPFVIGGVYIAIAAVIISLFVHYTFVDTSSKLGSAMKFFRFDEKWGTHRGFMWIKSWEIFTSKGIKNALIGWGCDVYYSAFSPYFAELNDKFDNTATNCAHNEYLNYLINNGILGLSAYLVFFGSVLVRAFRKAKDNYLALAFAAPIVCYLFQSVVNIATPITTPYIFIFAGLCEAVCREKSIEN